MICNSMVLDILK